MIWRQNTCVNWCPLESHPKNSSSQILLQVPVSRLNSYGDCAFSVAASLSGIGWRQILEMRRLLKICSKNTPINNNYILNLL